jgi:small subunit ribosomal protein S16
MLTIRLQRIGRKHDPSFRLVVTESARSAKSGSFLEILGSYDTRREANTFKKERILHWLKNGAQPSATARNILINEKILEGKKINVVRAKKKKTEKK